MIREAMFLFVVSSLMDGAKYRFTYLPPLVQQSQITTITTITIFVSDQGGVDVRLPPEGGEDIKSPGKKKEICHYSCMFLAIFGIIGHLKWPSLAIFQAALEQNAAPLWALGPKRTTNHEMHLISAAIFTRFRWSHDDTVVQLSGGSQGGVPDKLSSEIT